MGQTCLRDSAGDRGQAEGMSSVSCVDHVLILTASSSSAFPNFGTQYSTKGSHNASVSHMKDSHFVDTNPDLVLAGGELGKISCANYRKLVCSVEGRRVFTLPGSLPKEFC